MPRLSILPLSVETKLIADALDSTYILLMNELFFMIE